MLCDLGFVARLCWLIVRRVDSMKLLLSPKDNLGKMVLENVHSFSLEGNTLLIVFENGRTRNYPLIHLWYYESHVNYHKTEPLI